MRRYPLKFRRSKKSSQSKLKTKRAFMSTVAAHLGSLWGTDKLAMSIATGHLEDVKRSKSRQNRKRKTAHQKTISKR